MVETGTSATTGDPKHQDTKPQRIQEFQAPARVSIWQCFSHRVRSELAVNSEGPTPSGSEESRSSQANEARKLAVVHFVRKEVCHLTSFVRPPTRTKRCPAKAVKSITSTSGNRRKRLSHRPRPMDADHHHRTRSGVGVSRSGFCRTQKEKLGACVRPPAAARSP
jgi:hypothetical protein